MNDAPQTPSPHKEKRPATPPLLKLVIEMGPLVLFFIANAKLGILPATAVLMVAVVLSLALSYALTKHIPIMPLVVAASVLVFGTLTLVFNDSFFIKIKPTIINSLFGCALLGSMMFGKLILPVAFESVFELDEAGWRKLTVRWGLFFFFLAALNETVWRTQTEDFWVSFKVFGTMPITMVFAFAQVPLILRHTLTDKDKTPPDHW